MGEFEPTDAQLEAAARRLIDLDTYWSFDFCDDCHMLVRYPETTTDPACETCPADLDPLDGGCVNRDLLFEDERVVALEREMFEEEKEAEA